MRAELDLAEQQLGLLTHEQALAVGLSDDVIRRRIEAGRWSRVLPAVYAIGGSPPHEDRDLLAACLASGRVVAVSHRAAAVRWGLTKVERVPEISVDRERGVRVPGFTVHRSRDLTSAQIVHVGALPITTPARTLVDLGQVAPWYHVRDLLELFVSRRVLTVNQAHAALELHSRRGRNGCGALRRVLDERALLDRPSDSVLEAAFADLTVAHGLPRPVYQHEVTTTSGEARFIDFAYPDLRVAIEVDGFETHATAHGFVRDRVRGNELALLGWTVLRFTWHQVIHQPDYVAGVIQRAYREASRTGHRNMSR
ncbi:MAG TPA: type IV toxin-antitoxin system AbiEi family antitoxin domain-containing protein [Acidimicrobiales bacterium]|nr:type IV toxin-antitoxin system AbiEi family antitoxin domain-containing protein [Acidimicrobiales bacterium]